jgi:hypothetical protein
MREAARPNCQTLAQSHLTPGNAPTASHARCRSPHCILPARDLKTGVCFWGLLSVCLSVLQAIDSGTVPVRDTGPCRRQAAVSADDRSIKRRGGAPSTTPLSWYHARPAYVSALLSHSRVQTTCLPRIFGRQVISRGPRSLLETP